jgi:glycosyltransferase involved in cell wall biosynthesis
MLDPSALVSIIIPNYNYAQFVGEAIESALALDWPRVEVIVVDDGSTDSSTSVIERYASRGVAMLVQANSGQALACKAGFERSHGEVVIFLDSDDLLDPRLIKAMAPHWNPGVSKAQFQMKTVDAAGNDLGSVFPQYYRVPSPVEVRQWVLNAFAYVTPPGSGNAYSRAFLARVISAVSFDRAADSCLLVAAPFLGDVVTIAEPLVSYRIHGRNQGAMLRLDASRFALGWLRARRRFDYASLVARSVGLNLRDEAFGRNLGCLAYRTASWRVAPAQHPLPNESALMIIADAVRALRFDQGYSLAGRAALVLWIVLVCAVPRTLAVRLVNWRFVPSTRPTNLRRAMNALGIARMPSARLSRSRA